LTLIKFYGSEKISLKHTGTVINLNKKIQVFKEIQADSTLQYPMNKEIIVMKDCTLKHMSYTSMSIGQNVMYYRKKIKEIDSDDKPDMFFDEIQSEVKIFVDEEATKAIESD